MDRSFYSAQGKLMTLAVYLAKEVAIPFQSTIGVSYRFYWINDQDIFVSSDHDPMNFVNHTNSAEFLTANYCYLCDRSDVDGIYDHIKRKINNDHYSINSVLNRVLGPDPLVNLVWAHDALTYAAEERSKRYAKEEQNIIHKVKIPVFLPGRICPIW
jgi:hypothetical protein